MDLGIKGRTAFVMGGSRGIGRAIARELAAEGCRVAIVARNADNVEKEVENLRADGHDAFGLAADLSAVTSFDKVLDQISREFGAPEIAIFNPPQPDVGSFVELSEDMFANAFSEMVLCFMRMVKLVYPHMKEVCWGRIVTIGTMATKQPARGQLGFDYALANTARTAAVAACKTISAELAPYGITVNTVAPGSINTDNSRHFFQMLADKTNIPYERAIEGLINQTPARRVGQPEEVAGLVAYLCSNKAGFTTGETILCDGGLANCAQ